MKRRNKMGMQLITYKNGFAVEIEKFTDLLKALLFAEGSRGLADKFSIFMEDGSSLYGTYREGKGNLTLYEM